METEKDKAIQVYIEQQKKEAKERFQCEVNSCLNTIADLSCRLKLAKQFLNKLEYKEPEDIDLER